MGNDDDGEEDEDDGTDKLPDGLGRLLGEPDTRQSTNHNHPTSSIQR